MRTVRLSKGWWWLVVGAVVGGGVGCGGWVVVWAVVGGGGEGRQKTFQDGRWPLWWSACSSGSKCSFAVPQALQTLSAEQHRSPHARELQRRFFGVMVERTLKTWPLDEAGV